MNTQDVLLYKMKTLDDLSRDELIEAVRDCYALYLMEREHHESSMRMWELCRKAKASF